MRGHHQQQLMRLGLQFRLQPNQLVGRLQRQAIARNNLPGPLVDNNREFADEAAEIRVEEGDPREQPLLVTGNTARLPFLTARNPPAQPQPQPGDQPQEARQYQEPQQEAQEQAGPDQLGPQADCEFGFMTYFYL